MIDNLPAGFYLAQSRRVRGLILCFDARREKEEKLARKSLPLKKRNPFTVELLEDKQVEIVRGDYRQFAVRGHDAACIDENRWDNLATEDSDQQRIGAAAQYVQRIPGSDVAQASVIMQHLDATGELIPRAGTMPQSVETLTQQYVSQNIITRELKKSFFDAGTLALTPHNLKAMGQLFNKYGYSGIQAWFVTFMEMWKAFLPEQVAVYKKRLLDPLANWSSCLDKEEIDAIALSISTLAGHDNETTNWWLLVDAHGAATGSMRYASLWHAYVKLLTFIEVNKLTLDPAVLNSYLRQTSNFNACVFLDRLYRVLKNTREALEGKEISQLILNNLDKIDWRHNGFYYASRYQNYHQWSESLMLQDLISVSREQPQSYLYEWDYDAKIEKPILHALRFASRYIKLTLAEIKLLEQMLGDCFPAPFTAQDPDIIRLLICCIAQGVDNVEQLRTATIQKIVMDLRLQDTKNLRKINIELNLAGKLKPNTFQVHFADIPSMFNIKNLLISLEIMNHYGRALRCYRETSRVRDLSEDQFVNKLFALPAKFWFVKVFSPWLLPDCRPEWTDLFDLSARYKREVDLFLDQLSSVDYSKTSWFPTYEDLASASAEIRGQNNEIDAAKTRRQIVSDFMGKGFAITQQDAKFRPLSPREYQHAIKSLQQRLNDNFKHSNLRLCEKFLSNHLALRSEAGDEQLKEIEHFMALFLRIDNKAYYNELGQLLGLLIQLATEDGQQRRFSSPQLMRWIEAMINPATYDKAAYPLNVLRELIIQEKHGNLLHQNLNNLEPEANKDLYRAIQEIVQSSLSNRYKPVLVKLAKRESLASMQGAQRTLQQVHEREGDSPYLEALSRLYLLDDLDEEVVDNLTTIFSVSPKLNKLWSQTQTALILALEKGTIDKDYLVLFKTHSPKGHYTKIILVEAFAPFANKPEPAPLILALRTLNEAQLKELAEYYSSEPHPTAEQLLTLLHNPEKKELLIHYFETEMQATDANGQSKRNYSLSPHDVGELSRVLSGLKRKGGGFIREEQQKELVNLLYFTNHYSETARLHQKTHQALSEEIASVRAKLASPGLSPELKHYASARLLACMREIVLRKTGKWANHTQMLDLLYAALHNDESLLHQARTGEGKSIISIMRVAYLALNGYVVDLFSSKDSLSQRDHEEFSPVLEALGIPTAYITPGSPASDYQTVPPGSKRIGAVNFATIGNFSLFFSGTIWKDKTPNAIRDLKIDNRVAFLDEADHILRDETAQFNFADAGASDGCYNLDEWVYRVVDDFYQEYKDQFAADPSTGSKLISSEAHLKVLCERLQKAAAYSPTGSRFMQQYIIPTLDHPEQMQRRDLQLLQLLQAAHGASSLKAGEADGFSVRTIARQVPGDVFIDTRFAKVMINSQIREGSTYSEMVQQFLHVRLNREAVARGESPNFFVEPYSQIALSLNANFLLKTYYHKLEGCTGTAGDEVDRHEYDKQYGIKHIIKLPTHIVRRTDFLGTTYEDNFDAQIQAICVQIRTNADKPILITCLDDNAVNIFSKALKQRLSPAEFARITKDTNDSGIPESQILEPAGKGGAVTISSRLGRGTDIKPQTEAGLMVLRTYAAIPRVVKQERGRQGRNGARGTVIEIINYAEVTRDIQRHDGQRFQSVLTSQRAHLEAKLAKPANVRNWAWLIGDDKAGLREKYLLTRTCEQIKYERKRAKEVYLRSKENLIASLSGNVMIALAKKIRNKDDLRLAWLECRQVLESYWKLRLQPGEVDSPTVYQRFFEQASHAWSDFCNNDSSLNRLLFIELQGDKTPVGSNLLESISIAMQEYGIKWNTKRQRGLLTKDDLEGITAAKSFVRKVMLQTHPDKQIGNRPSPSPLESKEESKEQYSKPEDQTLRLFHEAGRLQELLDDCLFIANGKVASEEKDNSVPSVSHKEGDRALMPYQPGKYKPSSDMAEVISFYQAWVLQAKLQHTSMNAEKDSQVLQNIYWVDDVNNLDLFYKELQTVSTYHIAIPLSAEEQTKRRAQLFAKLTEVMKKEHGFPVSQITCVAWKKVILLLASKLADPNFNNYLNCVTHFFDQPDFRQGPQVADLSWYQIEKQSALFSLSMTISTVCYVDEETSKQFLVGLMQAIRRYAWGAGIDADMMDRIKSVFADISPDVTALLTQEFNDSDMVYVIELLRAQYQNKDILVAYLRENAKALMSVPGAARAVFSLFLTKEPNRLVLPKPGCLQHLGARAERDFWHFLSQRMPIDQDSCDTLIGMLRYRNSDEFIAKVFTPLMQLPPNVPVSYVVNHLQGQLGKHNFHQAFRPRSSFRQLRHEMICF